MADRIQRLQEKMDRSEDVILLGKASEAELKELQWKTAESERRVADKRAALEVLRPESDAELVALLANFDSSMAEKNTEVIYNFYSP